MSGKSHKSPLFRQAERLRPYVQVIKVSDWLYSLINTEITTNLTLKWISVDIAFCLILKRLRIPRLNYAVVAVLLQIFSLCMVDGVLFGTVKVCTE